MLGCADKNRPPVNFVFDMHILTFSTNWYDHFNCRKWKEPWAHGTLFGRMTASLGTYFFTKHLSIQSRDSAFRIDLMFLTLFCGKFWLIVVNWPYASLDSFVKTVSRYMYYLDTLHIGFEIRLMYVSCNIYVVFERLAWFRNPAFCSARMGARKPLQ